MKIKNIILYNIVHIISNIILYYNLIQYNAIQYNVSKTRLKQNVTTTRLFGGPTCVILSFFFVPNSILGLNFNKISLFHHP